MKANGFVNHVGRVNGNLNLSRAIGDLKYKQNPDLSPAEQVRLQIQTQLFILFVCFHHYLQM